MRWMRRIGVGVGVGVGIGVGVGVGVGVGGCRPDFGERASLVTAARVLAVRAEPAEAPPGAAVVVTPLVASPDGTLAAPDVGWAFCAAPKPLGENDVVAQDCLAGAVRAVGEGPTAAATMPPDACVLFGPEPPPGARPRDADVTGGYYQPLRAELGAEPSIALLRVVCNLGNASADVAADFKARYRANQNPRLIIDVPSAVAPGARVTFHASWRPEDAEAYVAFDAAAQTVAARREAMRVSWFVSAGALDADRTGRDESDPATTTDDGWIAPSAGVVHVWIVLRDSRGGVDFASADVTVR
jgi:hypothetical protein